MRAIVWFRGKDLRVADHTPLCNAIRVDEVFPLFRARSEFLGNAARSCEFPYRIQSFLDSLRTLQGSLVHFGSRLNDVRNEC
ncbi:hypothetical protein BCY86_06505 [Pajaroellobacter abortibovis]|uniref:Photolyase/cryptochrome alpha/beta domain-containing protein n=2 Tax=Pajaroellobacter abortibovis TaxID=1882918 RepID=A0A1L6MY83_9BACT|nr:hypothetical protein BCY86_06505 [Pajaroellobacter abortibovis]